MLASGWTPSVLEFRYRGLCACAICDWEREHPDMSDISGRAARRSERWKEEAVGKVWGVEEMEEKEKKWEDVRTFGQHKNVTGAAPEIRFRQPGVGGRVRKATARLFF
ncbi:hypothetical protein HPB50_011696 [Hyalomma asiaticum]|uniref:Uncharacterized protein n=1 Tax=Hyalomma asiaticum TaxID=266040 RepID=A0ACB7SUM6_HYAAI|nr:hypothetical protein HPB50_011696 [Hyalomma asiaticum]